MLEPARLDPELERSKGVLKNILRWEEDDGPVFESGNPLPQLAGNDTLRLMDEAGECLLYDEL